MLTGLKEKKGEKLNTKVSPLCMFKDRQNYHLVIAARIMAASGNGGLAGRSGMNEPS